MSPPVALVQYGLAALTAIVFVELILRSHFLGTASALLATSNKATRVMTSRRISDHWKEKAILRYSRNMMLASLKLALVLAAAGLLVVAIGLASERFAKTDLLTFLASWQGIVFATVFAFAYVAVFHRKRQKPAASAANTADSATSAYSTSDRMLHRMALSSAAVREMTFDMELAAGGTSTTAQTVQEQQVFVAGLARAGTTILMRSLYASGGFRSLTYRDMPFVLAPNLWRRIAGVGARSKAAAERAHGDGITVDYDSPEALEEVFWKTFAGKQYIHDNHLAAHQPGTRVIAQFRDYVDAIIRSSDARQLRYLSKNNNNILRLPAIQKAFPEAIIIIPFRDPVQQAQSLRRQHRRFVADNRADAFAGQYMAWLAHHEFGARHLPFCFDAQVLAELEKLDAQSLDYWLYLWAHVYRHLLCSAPDNALFLSYERLCDADAGAWTALLAHVGLGDWRGASEKRFKASVKAQDEVISESLVEQAEQIHRQLLARSL